MLIIPDAHADMKQSRGTFKGFVSCCGDLAYQSECKSHVTSSNNENCLYSIPFSHFPNNNNKNLISYST